MTFDKCGKLTETRRRDQRFCSSTAKCKKHWFDGSPADEVQEAARQKKAYGTGKKRDSHGPVMAREG
jgi:hypothetical protein